MKRFRPYVKYIREVRATLVAAVLCGMVYGLANGAGLPLMIRKVFPQIFSDHAAPLSPLHLFLVASWLPAVFLVRGLAGYLNSYLIQLSGVRMLEALRLDYFRKLQILPLAFIQRQTTGDLISRGLADANQLQNTLTMVANDGVKQPLSLIGSLGYLTWAAFHEKGVALVLVCLAIVPLCVFPIRYVGKKLLHRAQQIQRQLGSVTDHFSQNLAAAREVRAFGLEEHEGARFGRASRNLIDYQMKAVKYAQALTPAIEIISALGISLTLVYAYYLHVKLDSFIAIITALYVSYDPVKRLGSVNNEMKRGLSALERLEAVLAEPVAIADPPRPVEIGRLRGEIRFEQVEFSYKPGEPALHEISVVIPAGAACALVGPSGAGKTTFAQLVPRFYDPTEGRLTVDGLDLRALRLSDLRRNIAIVPQEPVLFNDTVYNNLKLGRLDATRQEIVEAARSAYADDFIRSLPKGYDTSVAERGGRLSVGQKQRLAIARAFLRDAPILVLDEATSALDSESEAAIQAALAKLMVGRTVIIIAHRFSTIRAASMILVLDHGRIAASGTHARLYAENALYKSLYDGQHPPGGASEHASSPAVTRNLPIAGAS